MCRSNQKREIRRRILQLRNSLSADDINSKSKAIEAKLWQLINERNFRSIMFYIAFGSEVRTQDCIASALAEGRTVLVPICVSKDCGAPVKTLLPSRLLSLDSEIAPGKFGVPEPKPNFVRPFPPEEIELIVVPGIAFDKRGFRIGHGAGYYDRFLPKCPQALFVGLAYDIQIVDDALPSAWDVPVHMVIAESRILTPKIIDR